MAAPALPREAATQRYRTRSRAAGIGRILVLTLGSTLLLAYLLGPIVWLVSSSVQTEAEIVSVPPHWIPDQPTLQNFEAIFFAGEIPRFQVIIPDFGIVSGAFQITSIEYSGQHDGEAVYELSMASASALAFEAA